MVKQSEQLSLLNTTETYLADWNPENPLSVDRLDFYRGHLVTLVALGKEAEIDHELRLDRRSISPNENHLSDKERRSKLRELSQVRELAQLAFSSSWGEPQLSRGVPVETYGELNLSPSTAFIYFRSEYKYGKTNERTKRIGHLRSVIEDVVENKLRLGEEVTSEKDYIDRLSERLTDPYKLNALLNSPHFKALPGSNREKNEVLKLLDYKDNPSEYPGGVFDALFEVVQGTDNVNARNHTSYNSARGPFSIVHELGDYFDNAYAQILNLRELRSLLLEVPQRNRKVGGEAENIGINNLAQHQGFRAILRERDILYYIDRGEGLLRSNPLITVEEDRSGTGDTGRKNKTVTDEYTRKDISEEFEAELKAAAEKLTVKKALMLIDVTYERQMNRAKFFADVINQIANGYAQSGKRVPPRLVPSIRAARLINQEIEAIKAAKVAKIS